MRTKFRLRGSRHQFFNSLLWWLSIFENSEHLLGDRHLDFFLMRQANCGSGGENAFGDSASHVRDNVAQFPALAKFNADAAIAREITGAGENQVSHSG